MKASRLYPLCFTLALAHLLNAQGEEATEDDQIHVLNPFVVESSNDRGYISTNSVSGTSLNTPIRDLPMPLEVVNQEFIEDLQASDLKESLEYSAGVFTETFQNNRGANASNSGLRDESPSSAGSVNAEFANNVSIRGYAVPNSQRFGFRVGAIVPKYGVVLGGSSDTVSTSRVEVVRGPQALLYGVNVLSGVVNVVPREPLPEYRTSFSAAAGNYGFLRFTLDTTGPLADGFSYRLMTAHEERDHWSDFRENEDQSLTAQLKWRFLEEKHELLLEGRHSKLLAHGIGDSYFIDNDQVGNRTAWFHQNEFGEQLIFGRDDPTRPIQDALGNTYPGPYVPWEGDAYDFRDRGNNFRISGPDTSFERKEYTGLALLRSNWTSQLSSELGAYYVNQTQESFDVDLQTFTDSRGAIIPTREPRGAFGRPPAERDVTRSMLNWFNNPEVNRNGTFTPLSAADNDEYIHNRFVGESFAFPLLSFRPGEPLRIAAEPDSSDPSTWERKYARYAWFRDEVESTSLQIRGRVAYTLESDWLVPARHTFAAGINIIQDDLTFNTASPSATNDNHLYSMHAGDSTLSQQDRDPYILRDSIFDMTPIRYEGEPLFLMVNPSYANLYTEQDVLNLSAETLQSLFPESSFPSLYTTAPDGSSKISAPLVANSVRPIARSGNLEATLWYRGAYALYQGNLWQDRIHVVAGIRQDQYQVREKEQLAVLDLDQISDSWQGTVQTPLTPYLIGDASSPYVSPQGIDPILDTQAEAYHGLLRAVRPEGLVEHNFDEFQKFTTGTFGLSYRIIDPVSVYYMYSEGVFPNTGQRDGLNQAIDAETTVNNEIGFKFAFMDGRLSGTISFFQIERENAVFYWDHAPAPSRWHGEELQPNFPVEYNAFAPGAVNTTDHGLKSSLGAALPVTYGIADRYLEAAFEKAGIEFPQSQQLLRLREYGVIETDSRAVEDPPEGISGGATFEQFYFAHYDAIREFAESDDPSQFRLDNVSPEFIAANPEVVLFEAFEMALEDRNSVGFPFYYLSLIDSNNYNNNPSNGVGRGNTITFAEEARGMDGQIIYSPTDNYQIMFNFSHQQREVTGNGFSMVDAVDSSGNNWGTRYDAWVYLLGVENFEDPTRASTFTGGSVNGIDLSFVPQTSLSLWNKYQFTEGPLDGFELGGGVQYFSGAPTSIAIGGTSLGANQFPTPDTPERYKWDAFLGYRFTMFEMEWRLALRIKNLLNQDDDTAYAEYSTDVPGVTERRRTEVFYEPRTWRLSLTASF